MATRVAPAPRPRLALGDLVPWNTPQAVLQVPQFIDNYRNQSAEALSAWFLAEWFTVRPLLCASKRIIAEARVAWPFRVSTEQAGRLSS